MQTHSLNTSLLFLLYFLRGTIYEFIKILFVTFRELSSTFARLCHLVDETTSEMDAELKTIATMVRVLEEAASNAKVLRNKANYLANELDLFDAAYLKSLN